MKFVVTLALTIGALFHGGCTSAPADRRAEPVNNVYSAVTRIPEPLRRVAVLPVTCEDDSDAEAGRDALQPVLLAELAKTSAFEVVPVSPEQLCAITGRSAWAAHEVLPSDFFSRMREATGCDAVLFCRLKQFRAYPPLAVEWDLKLVDANQRAIVWATDEVFDSGEPSVASAARRYYVQAIGHTPVVGDPGTILMSPRLFGQYAAAASLTALPAH
ncbi:MAG: hypothetical protein ABSA12_07240 [Verrucomicrobiia bacterium]|jgi:hypothetical protein